MGTIRTERSRNFKSYSWPKTMVRKWFNIKDRADEFHSDSSTHRSATGGVQARRKSCSDTDGSHYMMGQDLSATGGWLVESSENLGPPGFGSDPCTVSSPPATENLRMFVGTWNVGGRAPHEGLKLGDWLTSTPSSADIYVLGFQEIVPLNAGNVLGAEDKGPAHKWLSLIRQALNSAAGEVEVDLHRPATTQKPRVSFSDLLSMEDDADPRANTYSISGEESPDRRGGYRLVASKQMVGIFLCVWIRSGLIRDVDSIKISCVGRGIMGYMGNKGSISISMTVRQTTFCFVCTHLTSGEKDSDEVRRNSDVMEILKRTRFPQSHRCSSFSPDTIMEHDKVIWLGDLNYRIAASCSDTHELLERNDWQALLERDQLRIEQRAGRVFEGWEEGPIYFPPTYKYVANSDRYAVNPAKSKDKRRTPAWCDRILWRGKGMEQLSYMRGESRFSDHRPVFSLFSVQDEPNYSNAPSSTANTSLTTTTTTSSSSSSSSSNNSISSSASWGRVQAEELLVGRSKSCIESCRCCGSGVCAATNSRHGMPRVISRPIK